MKKLSSLLLAFLLLLLAVPSEAALSRNNRLQENSSQMIGTSSFTTASFTPANNTLLVVRVSAIPDSGVQNMDGDDLTTPTGGSLTYTLRCTSVSVGGAWRVVERVWTAPVSTGASMTITADAGTFSIFQYRVEVYEYSGYDTMTPVNTCAEGSDADGDGAASLTLGASPATSSEVIAFAAPTVGGSCGSHDTTPDGAWTELFDVQTTDCWIVAQSQVRSGSTSTSVNWTDLEAGTSDTSYAGLLALPVNAAASAATAIFRRRRQ